MQLASMKALRAAINVGVFPGEVEQAAKRLVTALDTQLAEENFEDDAQNSEIEELNTALDAAAAEVDSVSDDDDDEVESN